MSEGQTKRPLGKGMKPRGTIEKKDQNDDLQEVTPFEAEGQDSIDTKNLVDESLKLPDPTKVEPETPQDGFVAETDEQIVTSEAPSEQSNLAELMRKSAEHNEQELSAGMANLLGVDVSMNSEPLVSESSGLVIPTAEEIAAVTGGYDIPSDKLPTIAELDEALNNGAKVDIQPNGRVIITPPLGEQPDGTFKIVVTIPEGYIGSIRQQADVDHETPEEWVSKNFSGWLESWWSPPRTA